MSDAKWKLMADWQGDGEFAGADDDITPATLGLSLRHMRDMRSEYINPARLDIRLANFDHKYSPPNTASPLFGALKPGRKVWLRAAFPCDEFGDIAGTSLADHAPEYGAAYRWTDANLTSTLLPMAARRRMAPAPDGASQRWTSALRMCRSAAISRAETMRRGMAGSPCDMRTPTTFCMCVLCSTRCRFAE